MSSSWAGATADATLPGSGTGMFVPSCGGVAEALTFSRSPNGVFSVSSCLSLDSTCGSRGLMRGASAG
eukprot:3216459-Pyramimonas_sp.AAC.1